MPFFDEEIEPGRYSVVWNGRNAMEEEVGSGVYFYRIVAGTFVSVRKLALVR